MKKQIIVAVASLATVASVAGGGKLVANHYDEYKTNKQKTEAAVAQEKQAVTDQLKARVDLLQAAYDHERIECEKGAGAYGVLPTATKIKTASPVCGKPVLE